MATKPKDSSPLTSIKLCWSLTKFSKLFKIPPYCEFSKQVPDSMRSLGMALYLSANGMGSFISSLLVTMVSSATGKTPWLLPTNANRSRFDLFYWLLAVISMLNLTAFIVVAFFYDYKRVKSPLYNGIATAHTGLSHKDSLQRFHHRPSNASSTSSQ